MIPETAEQIALEAAQWLYEDSEASRLVAEGPQKDAIPTLARLFLAAIRRDRLASPAPGGLSEGRLAEIAKEAERWGDVGRQGLRDLLAHVAHLTRALREIVTSGPEGEAWCKGYEAGKDAAGDVYRDALARWATTPEMTAADGNAYVVERLGPRASV